MSDQRKAVIKNADMSEQMQQDAVDVASAALSKFNIEKVGFVFAFIVVELALLLNFSCFAGHGCLYQKGIRQEIYANLVSEMS